MHGSEEGPRINSKASKPRLILVTGRVCVHGSFGFKLIKLRARLAMQAGGSLVSSAPMHIINLSLYACSVIVVCNSSCDGGIIACVSCCVFGRAGPHIAFGNTKRNAAQRVPTMHVCCRPAGPVGRPSAGHSQSGPALLLRPHYWRNRPPGVVAASVVRSTSCSVAAGH